MGKTTGQRIQRVVVVLLVDETKIDLNKWRYWVCALSLIFILKLSETPVSLRRKSLNRFCSCFREREREREII